MRFSFGSADIAYLVLLAGMLLLYFEANHLGMIVPGVAGAVLTMLALASLSRLGVDWRAAVLTLAAVSALVMEARLGWYGILAGICIAGAAILAGVRPMLAALTGLPFASLSVYLLKVALRAADNKSSL